METQQRDTVLKCFLSSCLLIPCCLLFGSEEALSEKYLLPPQQTEQNEKVWIQRTGRFFFASASIFRGFPGLGLSFRSRDGGKGRALDWNLGNVFSKLTWRGRDLPFLAVDYNFLYFFSRSKATSLYASWGIGSVMIVPYVPLRLGVEGRYGFFDVGVKMVLLFAVPEARGGVSFKF